MHNLHKKSFVIFKKLTLTFMGAQGVFADKLRINNLNAHDNFPILFNWMTAESISALYVIILK